MKNSKSNISFTKSRKNDDDNDNKEKENEINSESNNGNNDIKEKENENNDSENNATEDNNIFDIYAFCWNNRTIYRYMHSSISTLHRKIKKDKKINIFDNYVNNDDD